MLTSQQVNALMAQQNAQFAMMQQQGSMGYAPAMGASQYPPSFNYGYNPNAGNRNLATSAASGVFGGMSAVGTGLGVVGGGLGIASMFSSSPSLALAAGALDFTGISAGFGAAGMVGGLGSAAGMATFGAVAAPVALGFAGAGLAGSRFIAGGREQAAINRLYSNEAFANPLAFSGRGFTPGQMMQIGRATRAIDDRSPFISGADAQAVGQMFREMGIARGIQNVDVISSKLKEFGKVAESVAKQLGTSIRDVQGTLEQNRRAGFFTAKDIAGNVVQMRVAEGMGMSREAFGNMQLNAVATTRGMGLTGQAGARASRGIANSILAGMQASGITSEELKDLTNAASMEEAVAMLGTQQTQRLSQLLLRPGIGRALLAGTGTVGKGGRFTGGIDVGLLEQVASGQIGLNELQGMAAKNLSTREGGLSFTANQKKLVSATLESEMAGEALVGLARRIVKDEYGGNEDALTLVMERLGIAEEQEQELFKKLYTDRNRRRSSMRTRIAQEIETERMQAERRQYYTLSGRFAQFSGTIRDKFAGFEEEGAQLYSNFVGNVESAEARLLGFRPSMATVADRQRAAIALGSGIPGTDISAMSNPAIRSRILQQLGQAGNVAAAGNVLVSDAAMRERLNTIAATIQGSRVGGEALERSKMGRYGNTWDSRAATDYLREQAEKAIRSQGILGRDDARLGDYTNYVLGQMGPAGAKIAADRLAAIDVSRGASGADRTEQIRKLLMSAEERSAAGSGLDTDRGLTFLGMQIPGFGEGTARTRLLEKGMGRELFSKLTSEEAIRSFDTVIAETMDDAKAAEKLRDKFDLASLTEDDVRTVREILDEKFGKSRTGKKLGSAESKDFFAAVSSLNSLTTEQASAETLQNLAGNLSDAGFMKELSASGISSPDLSSLGGITDATGKYNKLLDSTRAMLVAARQKGFRGEGAIGQSLASAAQYSGRLMRVKGGLSIADYYAKNVKDDFGGAYSLEQFQQLAKGYGPTIEGDEITALANTLGSQQFLSTMSLNTGSGISAAAEDASTELDKSLVTANKQVEVSLRQINEAVSITNENVRQTAKVVEGLKKQ